VSCLEDIILVLRGGKRKSRRKRKQPELGSEEVGDHITGESFGEASWVPADGSFEIPLAEKKTKTRTTGS